MDFNTMFNFYKKRREAILQSNMKKEVINSALSSCSISELDDLLEKNSELKELMFAPAKDLPQRYQYILEDLSDDSMNYYTLYALVLSCLGWPGVYSYFSKAGDDPVGWCAYHVSEGIDDVDRVDELKMFSFDLSKPNVVLLRDLKNLLDTLLQRYTSVSWRANFNNPANEIYEQVLEEYGNKGFKVKKSNREKGFYYTVSN